MKGPNPGPVGSEPASVSAVFAGKPHGPLERSLFEMRRWSPGRQRGERGL